MFQFKAIKRVVKDLRRNVDAYQLALNDPRTPRLAKFLLGFAMTYTMLPFDIIPDFIPLLGQLDDVILIPVIVSLALKMIPDEVMADCRLRAKNDVCSLPRKTRKK